MFSASKTSGPSGYNINNSLRFRGSNSAYLSRTPASAGSRTTWTWSAWVKRGALGTPAKELFTASGSGEIFFGGGASADTLCVFDNATTYLVTTQVFRDPSAWYHIVIVWDTTQATSSNRIKMYVNGSQVTAFSTVSYPAQNTTSSFNNNTLHNIGEYFGGGSYYFDGYMAEVNFIDGQALTPSSFGSTNATTGVWQPAKYTGSYGTNGFYLPFSDIGLTSGSNTGLGKDFSGNSNYWTTNNISVTAGTTYDAMTDSPTLTSATVANYCTLNPLVQRWAINAGVFSEANLKVTTTGSSSSFGFGTIFNSTGKWYWEGTLTAAGTATPGTGVGDLQCQSGTFTNLIEYNKDGSHTGAGASWATYTTNDIIGVALDCDGGNIYFYKNNTLQGSVALTSGVSYAPLMDVVLNATWAANFGQRPFSYTPPTGFNRLNTYNLSDSTIKKGNSYMDATLYTGNGANRSITNAASFKPDLVIGQARSAAYGNWWYDSVRGATKQIESFTTNVETTQSTMLTAFNADGFSMGTDTAGNQSSITYVGWQWQAGQGSTSSNTSGSITSTVSVSTTAGFSICTFNAGASGAQSFGHGLGVAPKMVIIKDRANAVGWNVYHSSVITATNQFLQLNSTNGISTAAGVWGSALPTSTLVGIGSGTVITANANGVAYCFAEIAGFSKFGSYTGNGSTDGVFVYLGFRPKLIIIKQSSAAGENWVMYDTVRNTYNVANLLLHPNLSNAESTTTLNPIDILSNGFKLRGSSGLTNTSSATYIYAAFAENPFKNALAR